MDIKLAVIAFAIHIVFFASIFDIYFTSPLVHGMTPQSTKLAPPARRLVLFVADGLRADKLYSLDEDGQTRAPYLRSIIENSGSWGISHTRVPTESRPGHVALIAGFYEDVSAVAKGWKENPVEFDSVFNESRYTWSWGSPDILPMFAKGATGDHVFTHCYGAEEEDFAEADASKSDTWVFDRVTEFFGNSSDDEPLTEKLREDKIVFFLHLLGIDTNGHSHKPYSKEYLENIRLVDTGVEKMVQLIEEYYHHDGRTAYVLTADHGMTDWGSHGASHPDETLTPVVAWGSGIQKPGSPGSNDDYQDSFSKDWSLSHLRRMDMNQADIAPLMSSLIGSSFPLNSVGMLPIGYLDNTAEFKAESMFTNVRQIMEQYESSLVGSSFPLNLVGMLPIGYLDNTAEFKADSMFTNVRQIMEQYEVKELHMQHTTLSVFFRQYKPLVQEERSKFLAEIRELLKKKSFEESIKKSQEAIRIALDGLNYYQTYDRLFLGTSVTLSYLGWMGYLLFQLVHHHTDLIPGHHSKYPLPSLPMVRFSFITIGVVVSTLLFLQSSPVMYYVYCLLPVLLWHAVCQRYKTFTDAFRTIYKNYGIMAILSTICFCVAGVEILVMSLFYREVVSLGIVAIAIWPLMSAMRKNHLVVALGWFWSCLILALFPLLPVVGRDTNIPLVVIAGLCILITGGVCLSQLPNSNKSRVFPAQLLVVVTATLLVYSTWSSIDHGTGLPVVNQVLSWCILVASFFVPSLVSTAMIPRLLSIGLSFSSAYILLSTSHEGFFCLVLCIVMLYWLLCEQKSSKVVNNLKLWDISFSDAVNLDRGPSRKLELADLRCAFFFVFFILTAFFGTGNIASINSFDPSAVYCFLTVFNPFVMGTLLLWKVAILLILVTCTFHAIHVVLRVPTASLFLVVLLMSDCMALQFFFLVRDSGSWLEIGTSISHYVIVMSMILFLNLLLVLAKFFTAFTFPSMRGKAHSL